MIRACRVRPALAWSRQYDAACRIVAKWPLRCTRITASHSSSAALTSIRSRRNPALFTSTSSPPNVSIACWIICCALSKSATSDPLASASPPMAVISSTTSCAGPELAPTPAPDVPRSFTTTLAPWRASSSACSRPRPRPAPVTMAMRPSQMPVMRLLRSLPAPRSGRRAPLPRRAPRSSRR